MPISEYTPGNLNINPGIMVLADFKYNTFQNMHKLKLVIFKNYQNIMITQRRVSSTFGVTPFKSCLLLLSGGDIKLY